MGEREIIAARKGSRFCVAFLIKHVVIIPRVLQRAASRARERFGREHFPSDLGTRPTWNDAYMSSLSYLSPSIARRPSLAMSSGRLPSFSTVHLSTRGSRRMRELRERSVLGAVSKCSVQ